MTPFSTTTLSVASDGRFGAKLRDGTGAHKVQISSGGYGLEAHADLHVLVPPSKKVDVYLGAGSATVSHVAGDIAIELDNGRSPSRTRPASSACMPARAGCG
jgi:hypothetical protein